MSTSPKHTAEHSSSSAQSPKRTKLPDGHRVICSLVDGVYYSDAVAIDGFLHELAQPPPAQPDLVTQETPGEKTIAGEVFRCPGDEDEDEEAAEDVGGQPAAAAPTRAVASIAHSVVSSGMRFPTSELSSGVSRAVLGLPNGARVKDSTIDGVRLADALVIDGRFVEIASLPEADAKNASAERVYVRGCTIHADNLILGEWPSEREIVNSFIFGKDNQVFGSMEDSSVVGCGNTLYQNVNNLRVAGDRNVFYVRMRSCQVKGSRNKVNAGMVNSRVEGNQNSFAKGLEDSRIKGDDNKFGGKVARCELTGDKNEFAGDVIGCRMQSSGCSIGRR